MCACLNILLSNTEARVIQPKDSEKLRNNQTLGIKYDLLVLDYLCVDLHVHATCTCRYMHN